METGNYKLVKRPNQHTFLRRLWYWFTRTNLYAFIVKAIKLFFYGSIGATLVLTGVAIDRLATPGHVFATTNTVVEYKHSPVMDRIAGCESEGNKNSKGSHTDKKGNVKKNKNTDGSIDVGKYQINSVHFLTAMELGYNVLDEKDNEEFAYYLYANKGTQPWYSSAKCWVQ